MAGRKELLKRVLPDRAYDALLRAWSRVDPAVIAGADALRLAGYRAFGPGYLECRDEAVTAAIGDARLLDTFANAGPLPARYGFRFDERLVEYPWLLSRLRGRSGRLLDAGSTLNWRHVLSADVLRPFHIDIVTLGPEPRCFWDRGVSYLFDDIRRLPFMDGLYDVVVCASTLEHVGADNTVFTSGRVASEWSPASYREAVDELRRVTKPGGRILFTVPFGEYLARGWFQQFDLTRLRDISARVRPSRVEETFYRYVVGEGWVLSDAQSCARCRYATWGDLGAKGHQQVEAFEPAASEAVACLMLDL